MVDNSNLSSNLGEGPNTSAVRVKTSLFNAVAAFQQVSIPACWSCWSMLFLTQSPGTSDYDAFSISFSPLKPLDCGSKQGWPSKIEVIGVPGVYLVIGFRLHENLSFRSMAPLMVIIIGYNWCFGAQWFGIRSGFPKVPFAFIRGYLFQTTRPQTKPLGLKPLAEWKINSTCRCAKCMNY